jgi:hypothetical protein
MSEGMWVDFVLPIIMGIAGWLGNGYRNKQKKESDIITNFKAMRDADREFIEECRKDLKESRDMNKRLEAKYNRKCKSVRAANKCKFTNEGDGCPVLEQEDKNERIYDIECANCQNINEQEND